MSQGDKKDSITTLRKWNLIAGGIDPKNDVIPASVGYGLEEGLQFAVSEITRLEEHIKLLEEAYSATEAVDTIRVCWCNHDPDVWTRCSSCGDKIKRYHTAKANLNRTDKAKEAKP